ncbi:MAG: TRAP transporter small permease, partial [Halarsenatibacteraceae bacterium]
MKDTIISFFSKSYKSIMKITEIVCALLLISMIGINTVGVFYRYVLKISLPWVPELSRYMLIWLTLLGTVIALDKEEHVSVSFFY